MFLSRRHLKITTTKLLSKRAADLTYEDLTKYLSNPVGMEDVYEEIHTAPTKKHLGDELPDEQTPTAVGKTLPGKTPSTKGPIKPPPDATIPETESQMISLPEDFFDEFTGEEGMGEED